MKDNIVSLLDHHFRRINTPEFIASDPVQFVHRYHRKQDIEIVGLLTATIAWGRRAMILSSCERMLRRMGESPYDFVISGAADTLIKDARAVHRTFGEDDFVFFLRGLANIYSQVDSLESVFAPRNGENTMWNGIGRFREMMLTVEHNQKNERHISDPSKNSACKRLHLFLRWMVRNDGIVDLGVWKDISPSCLSIPLDVHVGNVSRSLGILDRKQNDRKAVEQIDAFIRNIDPNDPVKYDYALFGVGVSGDDL